MVHPPRSCVLRSLALLAGIALCPRVPAQDRAPGGRAPVPTVHDVVVYGATSAGVVAAIELRVRDR